MRVRFVVAAALLVVATLPAPATADITARVDGVVAEVRHETWQDDPAFDGATGQEVPKTPFLGGVYSNPYYNASTSHRGSVGSYLGVTITLPEVSSDPTSEDAANYVITAEIAVTGDRTVDAKLTKEAPNRFLAEFDLDGDVGEGRQPLPPGTYDLFVEVYRISSDPVHGAERVGRTTEPLTHDPGRPTSSFMSLFPTDQMRKWTGIGGLEHVPTTEQVGIDERVMLEFNFPAAANQTATVAAFVATQRSPTGDGDVVVDREVLTTRATESGTIRKVFRPGDVLDAKDGDVIVVAAYLDGEGLSVGSSLIVVPASNRASEIAGYQPTEFGGPTGTATDGFEATVLDTSGGSGSVDAVALTRSGTLIAEARNVRSDTASEGRYYANFAYADIRDHSVTSYRIVSMVYQGTDQDTHEFHSMATASRGFTYFVPFDVEVGEGEPEEIPVSVTSAYTDHDNEAGEIGFEMEATLSVTGLPGNGTFSKTLLVDEGQEVTEQIPFPASGDGSYAMTVNISTPDVVAQHQVTATVSGDPQPLGVPGFSAAPLLAGLVVAALVAARRRD